MSRRPGNRPGRVMPPAHWRKIAAEIETGCRAGRPIALRDRALLTLAVTSSLRVSECVALDTEQIVTRSGRLEVRSQSHLAKWQAKGGRGGPFVIGKRARKALRAWIRCRADLLREAAEADRPFDASDRTGPLFLTTKRPAPPQHARMAKRTAQRAIEVWCERVGLGGEYSFHDLRHTAVTEFERRVSDPFIVARFARHADVRHSQRYTHVEQIQEAAETL